MTDRPRVHERIEILLADVWQGPRLSGLRRGFSPNLDSYHTDDPHELTVIVELPGVDLDSLTIAVSERVLVIAGERTRAKAGGRVYQQMEIEYGPFERRVRLAEDVDPTLARAGYDRGVVTISLPVTGRSASPEGHTIRVERE
jgi:HSP20 family protein